MSEIQDTHGKVTNIEDGDIYEPALVRQLQEPASTNVLQAEAIGGAMFLALKIWGLNKN